MLQMGMGAVVWGGGGRVMMDGEGVPPTGTGGGGETAGQQII
jgi:hypothetical protein